MLRATIISSPAAGQPRRPSSDVPVTFVHHAVGHERIILAMVHHRQAEHFRVFARAAHEIVVLHAMAVVGDGDDAGLFQPADGREFLAGNAFGNRAGDEDIHDAFGFGAFVDERDRARDCQSAAMCSACRRRK